MDKELMLALSFKEAPKELQEVALKHQENFLRLEKANAQLTLWTKEKAQAEKEYDQSQREFSRGISDWLKSIASKEKEEIASDKVR